MCEQNVILGRDIKQFALGIADDLTKGYKVALGFECPLFIPISENPFNLATCALLRANISKEINLLSENCLVVKV